MLLLLWLDACHCGKTITSPKKNQLKEQCSSAQSGECLYAYSLRTLKSGCDSNYMYRYVLHIG